MSRKIDGKMYFLLCCLIGIELQEVEQEQEFIRVVLRKYLVSN